MSRVAGRGLTRANWTFLRIAFSRPPLSDSLSARRTLVARSEWLFICKVVEAVYAAKAPKRHIRRKKLLIPKLCDFLTASLKLRRQSSTVDRVESKSEERDPPGR